ncbi:small RNA-binding protein 11, chloroplastic [Vigna unguiculata]|uniref:small RNA-binding protein 11, chloroplastic n=1 Tax=Vigna unguiculata TaxID=3917 RepID=UPI0010170A4D|nr:small RNA-binding protein 11, chloroplastic [Vigna unguiculata]
MAAVRKIIQSNKSINLSSSLFSFRRGIAYKLFVGGLSFCTTEKALSEAFSNYGQVIEAKVVTDRVSDRSKGFGFVTFASPDEAENAIADMKGKTLNGRVIFVDYAKPNINTNGAMPIARGPPEPTPDT